jgi:hypothetical protein
MIAPDLRSDLEEVINQILESFAESHKDQLEKEGWVRPA